MWGGGDVVWTNPTLQGSLGGLHMQAHEDARTHTSLQPVNLAAQRLVRCVQSTHQMQTKAAPVS